jgi:hypothetical protein
MGLIQKIEKGYAVPYQHRTGWPALGFEAVKAAIQCNQVFNLNQGKSMGAFTGHEEVVLI